MSITTPPLSSPRPPRSRTQSISSDRPSAAGGSLLSPPLSISPEAAFIAASAASQIVTNDHDTHAAIWYDQHGLEPSGETAIVSPAALNLVNNFLDQLLFNILSKSRSTSLGALRPAVTEVLKPKLAKDAINQADEELHEYLGGGDEDDLLQQGLESPQDWDLELVWKRTRLRCMVYSSLGDMEEEDEDYHMEQEGLDIDNHGEAHEDILSPAVAIFLTSILEYMGEQALVAAGQGAYHRLQSRLEKEVKSGTRDPGEIAERIVVDELDMDRVALDRTLGRLWRAWKKKIRSPTFESRPYSRNSIRSSHFRQNSAMPLEQTLPESPTVDDMASGADNTTTGPAPDEQTMASSVPLPVGERDIDEIEVPGLVSYSDDEDEEDNEPFTSKRPHSMLLASPPPSPTLTVITHRKRSNSVPALSIATFAVRDHLLGSVDNVHDSDVAEPVVCITSADGGDSEAEEFKSAPESDQVSPELDKQNFEDDAIMETTSPREGPAELEEDDVEHFEILTTARVSISGGNSPVISDSDGNVSRSSSKATRPASISSPRLIEVAGPKSPMSRSSSVREPKEASCPSQAAEDTRHRPQAIETIFRSPISSPVSRSPAKGHMNTPISEVDEDQDTHVAQAARTPTSNSFPAPPLANPPSKERVHAPPTKQPHATAGYPSRHHGPPSPIQEHVYRGTKVTLLPNQTPPEPQRRDAVPNRSYPPYAQDRAARRPSASPSVSSLGAGGKQDASDVTPTGPSGSRQIHTSGSSISSGTSRLKPVRTSEESVSTRPEDVARNFEELIQSDQTIQYTLTPESMRDFDVSIAATTVC